MVHFVQIITEHKIKFKIHTVNTVKNTSLFSGLWLIMFLFEGCLVRNQPESVLKMFLKLVSEIVQIIYY